MDNVLLYPLLLIAWSIAASASLMILRFGWKRTKRTQATNDDKPFSILERATDRNTTKSGNW